MEWITKAKINCAIKDCLSRCYGSRFPLTVVGKFVGELRSDPFWRDREVDFVERTVLRVLYAMLLKR